MALNIQYGVSTWLWTSPFTTASIDILFPKIAAMGFDVVEIAVEDPSLIDVKAVKEGLEKYGLEATVCGAFGPTRDLTHEDTAVHNQCFSYIWNCLALFTPLGEPCFRWPVYADI